MHEAILYIAVAYILLCKLDINLHDIWLPQPDTFSLNGHFSAVKFVMGYEKNMSFLVIAKSPKVWKKIEKIGLGSFKVVECTFYLLLVAIYKTK